MGGTSSAREASVDSDVVVATVPLAVVVTAVKFIVRTRNRTYSHKTCACISCCNVRNLLRADSNHLRPRARISISTFASSHCIPTGPTKRKHRTKGNMTYLKVLRLNDNVIEEI